jgi:hypothetical protein
MSTAPTPRSRKDPDPNHRPRLDTRPSFIETKGSRLVSRHCRFRKSRAKQQPARKRCSRSFLQGRLVLGLVGFALMGPDERRPERAGLPLTYKHEPEVVGVASLRVAGLLE